MKLILFLCMTAVFVSACDLPQPFRTTQESRALNTSLDLGARSQLLVTPVRGVPGYDGPRVFTDLLVGSLRQLDIPALTLSPSRSVPILTGRVIEAAGPESTFNITFEWSVVHPTGQKTLSFETRHTVQGLDWLERNHDMTVALASEAAREIEKNIVPQSSFARLSGVYLHPIEVLPGDGNTSLAAALGRYLIEKGVTLVPTRAEAGVEVIFEGGVSPLPNGNDLVVLIWQVYHVGGEKDGIRIGQIDLANPIQDGLVDGSWGNLAQAAAGGSAEGIIELLVQAGVI